MSDEIEIKTVLASDFRKNQKAYFEEISNSKIPIVIKRPKLNDDFVIMPKSKYDEMIMTAKILRGVLK